jgi:hypothetical protein
MAELRIEIASARITHLHVRYNPRCPAEGLTLLKLALPALEVLRERLAEHTER